MPDNYSAQEVAARRFYEALSTGELTLIDDALAPGWEAVPALRAPGAQGWKDSIIHLRGVFGNLTATIEDVIVDGDRIAVRTINRGTHRGSLMGVEGTGNHVEFRASDIHRFENGRIVQTWHLEDYFDIAQQLGLDFVPSSATDNNLK